MARVESFQEFEQRDPERAAAIRETGAKVLALISGDSQACTRHSDGYDPATRNLPSPAPLAERIAAAGGAGRLAAAALQLMAKQPSLSPAKAWDQVRAKEFGVPEEYTR